MQKLVCGESNPESFDTNVAALVPVAFIDKYSLSMYKGFRIGRVFGGLSHINNKVLNTETYN